jgi:DNA repair photolyase
MALRTTRGSGIGSGGGLGADAPVKGRGAASNMGGRFERVNREATDDGWDSTQMPNDDPLPPFKTEVSREIAKSIISRNSSPDLPFEQSINPYRGCEHGCIFCYARPSHSYLGLSPGLDFETRLTAKVNAAELLRAELAAPGYLCKSIALGANTDPYQPIEREWRITRSVLEVLAECDHPFSIVTKNAMVERDIDLLAGAAAKGLVQVYLSVTNLESSLARTLEPRASAPYRRIEAIKRLAAAGIPVGVLAAPMIPFINDHFLEEILECAAEAGATTAGYVLLRLPHEVAPLFKEWLAVHYPLKAEHVMSLVRQTRGGKDYDADFTQRHSGTGQYAELLGKRFELATRRLGLNLDRTPPTTRLFQKPRRDGQMALF